MSVKNIVMMILKRRMTCIIVLSLIQFNIAFSQKLPLLKVSKDSSHFVTENDNKPFFWLGGTAWEMIHRLNREEVNHYLEDRANKKFTIIQTVILAELDGILTPNAYGEKPLINQDPTQLNEKYFEHVDYIINQAEKEGLYVGLLPTWGDKFNLLWGPGPVIFNTENALIYGQNLAKRYLHHNNIVWILGGDRGIETDEHAGIVKAMAEGILSVDTTHLISYHPDGAKNATDYLNTSWLDFDMFQSGHSSLAKEYDFVEKSKKVKPKRPIVNGEGRYENIGDRFWEKKNYGWLDDSDVRLSAYWSILAGAAGFTYGCNDVWQMYDVSRTPVVQARTDWQVALNLPGSYQMGLMRDFFESLDWWKLLHDQSLIISSNEEDGSYAISAIGAEGKFAVIYLPTGKSIEIDLRKLNSQNNVAYWFNPRSGSLLEIGVFSNQKTQTFEPWSSGQGSDFILLLMDENLSFNLDK